MGLDFEPEPISMMKARLPSALTDTWLASEWETFEDWARKDRPGKHRKHVFDFESGLRLIISRDRFNLQGKAIPPFIHLSASWSNDPPASMYDASVQVKNAWSELGGNGMPDLLGMSLNGVLHYRVQTNDRQH